MPPFSDIYWKGRRVDIPVEAIGRVDSGYQDPTPSEEVIQAFKDSAALWFSHCLRFRIITSQQYKCLVLVYLEGHSMSRASKVLGLNVSTVHRHIFYALKKIRLRAEKDFPYLKGAWSDGRIDNSYLRQRRASEVYRGLNLGAALD